MNPYNHKLRQTLITDANGVACDRGFIAHFKARDPVAAAVDSVLVATALTAESQTITEGITNPDYPRAIQIKGNAAGITGDVVISGTNYDDKSITETIALNGDTIVHGNKAFKTITSIELPVEVHVGTDTVSVGVNDKLGLPYKLTHNTILLAFLDNTQEETAPTVAVSSTNIEDNIVDLNSALDGTVVDLYLIV